MRINLSLLFVLAFLLIGFIPSLEGQSLRLYAGANYSQLSADTDTLSGDGQIGYLINLETRFGNRLHLLSGVQYCAYRFEYTNRFTEIKDNVTLHSVKVPLLFGYDFIYKEDFKFGIVGGPSATFLLNVSANSLNLDDETFSGNIISFDINLAWDIDHVAIKMGGDLGLSNVYKQKPVVRNNILSLQLGYTF